MSPVGPGKYDAECTAAREACKAKCVILIVIEGDRGDGLSAQFAGLDPKMVSIPGVLRDVARMIEADLWRAGR